MPLHTTRAAALLAWVTHSDGAGGAAGTPGGLKLWGWGQEATVLLGIQVGGTP